MADLEVYFDGLVAWVPSYGANKNTPTAFAVLMPDAFADRAPWIEPSQQPFLHVREPHTALLLFGFPATSGHKPDAVIADQDNKNPRAAVQLRNSLVTIEGLKDRPLTTVPGPGQWPLSTVPQMSKVSLRHQWARAKLDPRSAKFDPRKLGKLGLAGALAIDRGNLAVTKLFDTGRKVDFGLVVSRAGRLEFSDRVWRKRLGNQVVWTTPLAGSSVKVSLENKGGQRIYELMPGADGVVRITLANAELEVPVFRQNDASIPPGRRSLPDPDFGVFYRLSASASKKERRFAVPRGGVVGTREKPCAPAMYSGFR